jgi:hypothetical protein
MKHWTQRPPRVDHLVDTIGANLELQTARSSLAALDRTQTPRQAYDATVVAEYALHRVWTFTPDDINPTHPGEQDAVRDTDTGSNVWAAVTYQQYGGGWRTAFALSLAGHKGGSLLVDWAGHVACNNYFAQTSNGTFPGTPRRVALRIVASGVTLAETQGPHWPIGDFRLVGHGFIPAGAVPLELQYRMTAQGPDDAITDAATTKPLMQAHVFGAKVLAIGRWR